MLGLGGDGQGTEHLAGGDDPLGQLQPGSGEPVDGPVPHLHVELVGRGDIDAVEHGQQHGTPGEWRAGADGDPGPDGVFGGVVNTVRLDPMTDRAALYARQSVTRSNSGKGDVLIGGSASLDEQVRQCTEAAKRLGIDLVADLVEKPSTSGYKERGRDRPQFKELLELVRTGRVDCVIAYNTDRLSRGGGPGWAPLLDAFEASGRDLDRAVATPGGWVSEFEIGIRATMDREESKKTSERMTAVRAREARDGQPRPSGQRGFGYSLDWMAIDETEAALIHEAAGRVLRGEPTFAIATDWNTRAIPTVNNKQWTVSVLTTILRSPRIAGLREHNGTVTEGKWPAIVDSATHEQLKAALATKRRRGNPHARVHPLVGILRCGLCGGPLRSLIRENGTASYACRKLPGLGGCGRIRIKAQPTEAHVQELVLGMLADPATREVLEALQPDEADDDVVSIGEQIRGIEKRRERLVDLFVGGDLDKASYRRRISELDAELHAAELAFADHLGHKTLVGIPSSYEALEELWDERGIEFQRLLVEAVLEPITVKPAELRGRKTFDPSRLVVVPRG